MYITLKSKQVKIKKSRQCWGCGFNIDIGKTMNYVVAVDDYHDFNATYWCEVCDAYINENGNNEGAEFGFSEHEFRGEPHYHIFKLNYLCQERLVLTEKFNNPCKKQLILPFINPY
jgi:hypothetical protein